MQSLDTKMWLGILGSILLTVSSTKFSERYILKTITYHYLNKTE